MAERDAYYYIVKDGRRIPFASRTGTRVEFPDSWQTLSREATELKATFVAEARNGYGFEFICMARRRYLSGNTDSYFERVIHEYCLRVAMWRQGLLQFLVARNREAEFAEIIRAARELSGYRNMVVGQFADTIETFVFELPEGDDPIDNNIFCISKEHDGRVYKNLLLRNDFCLKLRGAMQYMTYQLKHGDRLLGVVLFGENSQAESYPYSQREEFLEVLANFFVALKSRRLASGRKLLAELFGTDRMAGDEIYAERIAKFRAGSRLAWIDEICRLVAKHLSVEACTIFWKSDDQTQLALAGSTHGHNIEKVTYPLEGKSLTVKCLKTRKPVYKLNVGSESENSHIFDEEIALPHQSWLAYPIEEKGICIGVLRLLHKLSPGKRVTYFTVEDIENASLISNFIATYYEELGHYKRVYQTKEEAQAHLRKAEAAQARTAQFMKSLTHEIERPIPAIGYLLEYLYLAMDKCNIPEGLLPEKKTLLLKIKDCRSGLDLLQVIVNTIGMHSRKIVPKYVEKNILVDLLVPLHRMLSWVAKGSTKDFVYLPEQITSWATLDFGLITQVLVILLLNAFKYANDNSTIFLRVTGVGECIEFEVEDVGEVIAPEDTEKIFGWEYRGATVIAKGYPGAGIGLFLAKRICEALGANIAVKQRVPKTIFAFTVPRR